MNTPSDRKPLFHWTIFYPYCLFLLVVVALSGVFVALCRKTTTTTTQPTNPATTRQQHNHGASTATERARCVRYEMPAFVYFF